MYLFPLLLARLLKTMTSSSCNNLFPNSTCTFIVQVSCDITFLSPSNGICSVSMWWTSGWHFGRGLLLGTEIYKRLQGTFAASGGWELHRYTDRTHYATLPCYLQARYVDELEGNMMVIHIKLLNDNLKSNSCWCWKSGKKTPTDQTASVEKVLQHFLFLIWSLDSLAWLVNCSGHKIDSSLMIKGKSSSSSID